MAKWLLDTNVLVRLADPASVHVPIALHTTTSLLASSEDLYVTAQKLIEFWAVPTRPIGPPANGFGLTIADTKLELSRIRSMFGFLPDSDQAFVEWEKLVVSPGCSGKQAHGARLVAVMPANGIVNLLSFNDKHFQRYAGITVVNPHDL